MLDRIPYYVWPIAALAAWGGALLFLGLVGFTPYGLDEGAARALLLNWSTSDQIANPVFIFEIPDFRAMLFIPLGIYWSGSMIAAKVFTIIISFIGIAALYYWARKHWTDEVALLASGLMLVAPLTLLQIDAIDRGVFLLFIISLGLWVDAKYRTLERSITGWYFVQMLLVAITITIHPMGLAYPAALAWNWYRVPVSKKHQQHMFIGLAIATGIILAMGAGWIALAWFNNPLPALAHIVYTFYPADPVQENALVLGTLCFILLLVVLLFSGRQLLRSLPGQTLLGALVIGLFCADLSWAFIAQIVILYGGVALLIEVNKKLPLQNFFGQRGIATGAMFIILFWYMQMDRARALNIANEVLNPVDQIIHQLSLEAADVNKHFLVASQWPARTMIAVRRDVLPLPPPMPDSATLWKNIKTISHIVFAHNDPKNYNLAQQLAELITVTQTVTVDTGGAIIAIKDAPEENPPAPTSPAPPAEPATQDAPESRPAS